MLADSASEPCYIETLPRVGYRIIVPVKEIPATPPLATVPVAVEEIGPAGSTRGTGKVVWKRLLAVSIALGAAAVFYQEWPRLKNTTQLRAASNKSEIRSASGGEDADRARKQPASPVNSAEAHEFYLKGIYFWNQRSLDGFRQAIQYFQRATKADPTYALAYAGLANSYTLLTAYSGASAALYMPQARAAALRALELDENSAEAHTALALIVQNQDWDWQTSEKEFRRAVELNPNYATAHHWYAEHLMWMGRFDEALKESEKARQLDPLSLIIAADNGAILYFSRQGDRAIEQFRSVLRRDPNSSRAGLIFFAYVEKKQFSQALTEANRVSRIYGDGPWYWSRLAYMYGRAGKPELARRELKKLEHASRHEQPDAAVMIWAHLGVSDKEEALADLEKAYSENHNILTSIRVEPAFDPLRSDPRFQDLLRRVGLSE